MKSNNLLTILVSLFFLVSIVPGVTAQMPENEADIGINPGSITAESPLHFIDVLGDNFRYTFANQENKVEIGLDIANERLSEIYVTNSTEAIQKAEQNRERIIDRLRNRNNTEEEKQQIRQRLQKHVQVLNKVRENAPEEAHRGLDTAIQNSQRGINNFQNNNGQ